MHGPGDLVPPPPAAMLPSTGRRVVADVAWLGCTETWTGHVVALARKIHRPSVTRDTPH